MFVSVVAGALFAVVTLDQALGFGMVDHVIPATRAWAKQIESRLDGVDANSETLGKEMEGLAAELKAYTFIDRRIRDLLRARCMGAQNLDGAIADWKAKYEKATGEKYIEPSCEALLVSKD